MEKSFEIPAGRLLLKDSWNFYASRFLSLLILVLPLFIVDVVNHLYLSSGSSRTSLIVASTLITSLFALFTKVVLLGNITVNGSFGFGFKNFTRYLWLSILEVAVCVTGLLLFIVPGIIWLYWFVFSSFILADEGIGGMNALLKSREYMRGRSMYVFLRLVFIFVVMTLPAAALSIIAKHYPSVWYIGTFYNVLVLPLYYAYLFNLYKNIKSAGVVEIRPGSREGFKVAAWIGGVLLIISLAFRIFSQQISQRYFPEINRIQNAQSKTYNVLDTDIANIPNGRELADYIVSELKQGVPEANIRKELAKALWPEAYVDQVFKVLKVSSQ